MRTIQEVAEALKVHEVTVRRWIKAGKLQALQLPGGDYRITDEEYARFIAVPPMENNGDAD